MSTRQRIYVSEEDFDMIDRAAYWEGFKNPSAFIVSVVRRHIEHRQAERGSHYGKAKWPRSSADEEGEAKSSL